MRHHPSAEPQLRNRIEEHLKAEGHLVFRMNSGMVRARAGWVKLAEKGTADLLCFTSSRTVWIETKAVHGRQTKEQLAFEQTVCQFRHAYLMPRSWEQFLALWRDAVA